MRQDSLFTFRSVCWIGAATAAFVLGFYGGGSAEEQTIRRLMTATELQIELAKDGINLQHQILSLLKNGGASNNAESLQSATSIRRACAGLR